VNKWRYYKLSEELTIAIFLLPAYNMVKHQ